MEAEDVDEDRDVELNDHVNNNAEEAADGNVKADKQASRDIQDGNNKSSQDLTMAMISKLKLSSHDN